MKSTDLASSLSSRFDSLKVTTFRNEVRLAISPDESWNLFLALKQEFGFDYLVDITCVDYLLYRGAQARFGLVYLLANAVTSERVTVRIFLDEPHLVIRSIVSIWEGANWMEREVYDMFGIKFDGHPDLRRILMPEPFTAFPLRKDYPLQGRGERHHFPVIRRGDA